MEAAACSSELQQDRAPSNRLIVSSIEPFAGSRVNSSFCFPEAAGISNIKCCSRCGWYNMLGLRCAFVTGEKLSDLRWKKRKWMVQQDTKVLHVVE
jgi:hypothetical protein